MSPEMGDVVASKRARVSGGLGVVTASEVNISSGRRKRLCEQCDTRAYFNHRGQTKGRFCSTHKEPGMINVTSKKCEYADCESITPSFNYRGKSKGRFCGKHKQPGMIDIKSKRCEHADCETLTPCFNHRGETKGRFCSKHKQPGMIDIKSKRCEHAECKSLSPCFNHRGETTGRFCSTHKHPGMIDIKHKRCDYANCDSRPNFNHRGQTKGRFCGKHKHPGMIDIKHKRCEHADCESLNPVFNNRDQTKGRFCSTHKETGMIDVISKRCEHSGCESLSCVFNHRGQTKGRFCSKHKQSDMIDIMHKRCEQPGCDLGPTYGLPGHRPTHCVTHRKEGMIRNSFTKCMEPNCKDPAIYGIHRAVHCTLHTVAGENNLIGKVCVNCGLIDVVDAHGRCNICDPEAFRRYRLAKQREVKAMLDNSEHKNYVLYDRVIDGGECGRERPDWMWDCGTHQLILECDEDGGHKTRQEWCECTRMVNISQSAGMPVVFLRYNPDSFVRNGKARNENLSKRRDILFRWIAHLKKTPPAHFLGVMQLFYDEYKEGNENLECILEFDFQM